VLAENSRMKDRAVEYESLVVTSWPTSNHIASQTPSYGLCCWHEAEQSSAVAGSYSIAPHEGTTGRTS
jgi:hypothetical protein